jgi:CBS domain-containing protein
MLASGLDSLITFNPWTLSPATTLADAVRLVEEPGWCGWPIVDDGELVGLVSEVELSAAVKANPALDAPIGRYMQSDARPIGIADCPRAALERMLRKRLAQLPVVDGGRVVGTLSLGDFLRELSYGGSRQSHDLVVEHMQKSAESLDGDLRLSAAFSELNESSAACLPVAQGDFPLGAVTRRGLMRLELSQLAKRLAGEPAADPTLAQLLQSSPTSPPGGTLAQAAGQMVERNLDALAVAGQAAHLLGVITDELILRGILSE